MNAQAQKYTMTRKELAARLGVSMPTADSLINRKGFPVLRVGKRILIPVEAFEKWLNDNAGKGAF